MKKCQVIIPVDVHPYPEAHELSAALILAHFFETNVEFIRRTMTIKSADVKIKNVEWELKKPDWKWKEDVSE